jgi:hypothetical protein
MSALPTGSFASPDSSLFIANGGPANFSYVSTPSLFVSTINNSSYPPASGPNVVYGKLTIAQGFGSTISVLGCLSSSTAIVTPCITNGGEPNVLLRATAGTNAVDVAFQAQVPGGTVLNYAVFI